MSGTFDISSPNCLGGNNVHNTLILLGVVAIAWKVGVFKRGYSNQRTKKIATRIGWLF